MRLRRSELTTPGSSRTMLEKAASSEADMVMLDLEDAVAPSEKADARDTIIKALEDFDWSNKVVSVRINDLEHPHAYRDIIETVESRGDAVDMITIPKIKHQQDVAMVDTLLSQIEENVGITDKIGIEALIEEAEAIQQVDEIAAASDRLEALIFGPGDYSASTGMKMESIGGTDDRYPGDIWHYVRNKIVIAASANGLDAIDGPFGDIDDPEGYRTECERSRTLGFIGKWAIHPSQIEIANDVFAPTDEEVAKSHSILDAMETAQDEGLGAVEHDGELLDEASLRMAKRQIELAEQIRDK